MDYAQAIYDDITLQFRALFPFRPAQKKGLALKVTQYITTNDSHNVEHARYKSRL